MGCNESKILKSTRLELNIWEGGNGNVGHVSMYLPDNYLYASYWPNGRGKCDKPVPSATKSYYEDKREFGREADFVLRMTMDLDSSAMEKEWEKVRTKNYSFLRNNCSDAVFNVFNAGADESTLLWILDFKYPYLHCEIKDYILHGYIFDPIDTNVDHHYLNVAKIYYVCTIFGLFRAQGLRNAISRSLRRFQEEGLKLQFKKLKKTTN